MVKMNMKLLLRNKGYLAFLIILPIISVIMLNINIFITSDDPKNTYVIHELKEDNEVILSVANTKLNVKIYDSSHSKLSDYVIENLAKTGAYGIYRYQEETIDVQEAREKALKSANHNIIGAVIYIPDTFETDILSGGNGNIVLFEASEDGRIELLSNTLDVYLKSLVRYALVSDYNSEELNKLLETSTKNEVKKEMVNIEVGDTLNLTAEQQGKSANIGYSLAFLTISFLFSGVFIAATVVEERHNRVYNRFLLSLVSFGNYGIVKLLMIFITVLIQTGIIAIGIKLLVKTDFGIPFTSYLFLVFCLGLIFNLFSVVIGILTNNVLTSNYIAFLAWTLSALLAGLYFPINGISWWWESISMLMPQRWVVKAAEMIMAGKSGVYSMFLMVVSSYLIIIMGIGFLGIKMNHKE
jgi:ABC-2 type transport system permease protein